MSSRVADRAHEAPFRLRLAAIVWSTTVGTFCATTLAFYCLHYATYLRGAREFWPTAQYWWDIAAGGFIFGALFLLPVVAFAILIAVSAAYVLGDKMRVELWLVCLLALIATSPFLIFFGADWMTIVPALTATLITAVLFFRLQTGRWI